MFLGNYSVADKIYKGILLFSYISILCFIFQLNKQESHWIVTVEMNRTVKYL